MRWLIFLLVASVASERPPDELEFDSTDSSGHHRFLPQQCCQLCNGGEEYKNLSWIGGRCILNASAEDEPVMEIDYNIHLHAPSCCFFCGAQPSLFKYVRNVDNSSGHCKPTSLSAEPETKCIVCEAIVGVIKNLLEAEEEGVKDQLMVYCDALLVAKSWCKTFVRTNFQTIMFLIESNLHLTEICSRYMHLCQAPDNMTLTGGSRHSILDPVLDGRPRNTIDLLTHAEITEDNLKDFVSLENLSSEDKLHSLRFLAKFKLIYNELPCSGCGGFHSLIKQASHIDGWMWRCPDCRSTGGRFNKVAIRKDSFFFQMRKSIGSILAIAANWVNDPTFPLEETVKKFLIERETLIHYRNYYHDLVQLFITYRSVSRGGAIRIGGNNKVVEVEHTIMYQKKYKNTNANRALDNCLIFIERNTKEVVIEKIAAFDLPSVALAISTQVNTGTKLTSSAFGQFGGAREVEKEVDRLYPQMAIKVFEWDAPSVRTGESVKWGTYKEDLMRYSRSEPRLSPLLLTYVMKRTEPKAFNALLFAIALYDPNHDNM